MKRFLIQTTCVLAFTGITCWADVMHGYCGGSSQCTNNPPTGFGFTISGNANKGGTGNLLLDILIPNNDDPNPPSLSFDLTGTLSGTASLFSTTAWTSGSLDAYLGINASPSNPIGNYLSAGTTGFFVYQADFASATIPGTPHPNTLFLENFASGDPGLPKGSYITGFFNRGTANSPNWVATPNSGVLFVNTDPPVNTDPGIGDGGTIATPEPSSIILLSFGVLGAGFFLKRKAHNRA